MWRGVRHWHFYWQTCSELYYHIETCKLSSKWNNFIPPFPQSVILPEVCHWLIRYSDSCRKCSGTGAFTNKIAMYDFWLSYYTVVPVDYLWFSLHLIFPGTYHLLIIHLHPWRKFSRTDATIQEFQWNK